MGGANLTEEFSSYLRGKTLAELTGGRTMAKVKGTSFASMKTSAMVAVFVQARHEGAIQLVNGKAKLVSESYCDGLGDCR